MRLLKTEMEGKLVDKKLMFHMWKDKLAPVSYACRVKFQVQTTHTGIDGLFTQEKEMQKINKKGIYSAWRLDHELVRKRIMY